MTPIPTPNNAPVLIIDDMYTEEELGLIWEELQFLTSPKRLREAKEVKSATDEYGEYKKTSNGMFLDTFYTDRGYSNILEVNRKLFAGEILEHALKLSIFYGLLKEVNSDHTLINYYDDTQTYAAHADTTVFTAVTTFYKEPAHFDGGDLHFPEVDLKVEKRNNRMVMFPGSLQHAVTPVAMRVAHPPYSGYGRYGMAQFLTIR